MAVAYSDSNYFDNFMQTTNKVQVPLITVGIPVYNAADVISHAIRSVLDQTFCDFELIIIDDGSTDDTWKVIKEFDDARIITIRGDKNIGISGRLNEQIALARGKFFARMDADDIMMKERLQQQVDFLTTHPDVDLVGSSAIVMDERYQLLGIRGRKNMTEKSISYSRTKGFMHPTVLGKTEWFRKNRYNENYCGYEDYELWNRTSKYSVFYNLNIPLLFYQDHTHYELGKTIRNKVKGFSVYGHVIVSGNNSIEAVYQLIRNILAIPIIIFTHFIHLDRFLIGLRNQALTENEKKEYGNILAEILAKR